MLQEGKGRTAACGGAKYQWRQVKGVKMDWNERNVPTRRSEVFVMMIRALGDVERCIAVGQGVGGAEVMAVYAYTGARSKNKKGDRIKCEFWGPEGVGEGAASVVAVRNKCHVVGLRSA